jgi:hypothetical protein
MTKRARPSTEPQPDEQQAEQARRPAPDAGRQARRARARATARHEARDARYGERNARYEVRNARVSALRRDGSRGEAPQKAVGRESADDSGRADAPLPSASAEGEAVTVHDATSTKSKGGRPRIRADRPLTQGERNARRHLKPGAQQLDAHRKWKDGWDAMSDKERAGRILQDICVSRSVRSDLDRAIATRAVAALAKDNTALFVKLLELLPAARIDATSSTHGTSAARAHVLQMIMGAIAADRVERRRRADAGEVLTERERLQLQMDALDEPALPKPDEAVAEVDEVAQLRAKVAQLEARLGEAPPPVSNETPAVSNETPQKTITPSIGDIVPPSEIGEVRTGMQRPPPSEDFARFERRFKPGSRQPVLDLKPEPQPAPPQSWDETEGGKAWHEWRERNPHLVDYL